MVIKKLKAIKNKRMFYQIVRRRVIYLFFPWRIFRSLKKRRGSCADCKNNCCRLGEYACEYFIGGKCSVYGTDKMPTLCFLYPFDKADIWQGTECEFHWE